MHFIYLICRASAPLNRQQELIINNMLFSEAIGKFIKWKQIGSTGGTLRGYELDLRGFCLYLKNPHIEMVRVDDIIEYFDLMKQLGWKQNGFTTKSIALRKFFEFYGKQGLDVLNFQLVPVAKREYNPPRVATEEEYLKLLGIIPERTRDHRYIRNRALVNMLWDTGARVGELLSLKVPDLDLQHQRAVIKTEKSQGVKPFRQIFWFERTNESLQNWLERRSELEDKHKFQDPEMVFIGCLRWQLGKRLSNNGVATLLSRYSQRAGINPTLNAHSFRHHFGLELAKKGANNSVISNLMGHSSLMSSYRYTIMRSNELEEEYRRLMKVVF